MQPKQVQNIYTVHPRVFLCGLTYSTKGMPIIFLKKTGFTILPYLVGSVTLLQAKSAKANCFRAFNVLYSPIILKSWRLPPHRPAKR